MITEVSLQERQLERAKEPLRTEDIRLLKGEGHFVEDFSTRKNLAYMSLVHSPFAHAKIKSIDLSKARMSSGYIACLTGEDLVNEGVASVTQNQWPRQKTANRFHLAVGKVRFVGEPVVAILAKDRASAEDLVELVDIEYEELPPITNIEESRKHSTLVYNDWNDNVSQRDKQKYGDAEKAISNAAYVIRAEEGIRRQGAVPIEPHSVVVSYDKAKYLFEVYATVQSVHSLQDLLSSELKIPKSKFHVRVMDMGGGFGTKGGASYPWPLLACLFAKKSGCTVKWTSSRTEEFLESASGRDEYCEVTLACDKDGRIKALKARIECDIGVSGTQVHMPSLTMWTMPGPYKIPNVDIEVVSYVTNKMPIGPVRGAGAPEGCYFIERAIEIMAKKIGIDPIELRRRNIEIDGRQDSQDLQRLVDTLVKSSKYEELAKWRDNINSSFGKKADANLVAGIGISLRGAGESDEEEEGDWGNNSSDENWEAKKDETPSQESRNDSGGRESWATSEAESSDWTSDEEEEELSFMTETARVALKSGAVTVYTGSSPHGQGHETAFAQLVSEELGVPFEKVRVIWGDTRLIPQGVGTFGSRSAATGGSAVVEAARKLKADLLDKAAKMLKVNPGAIDIQDGSIVSIGKPRRSILVESLGELPRLLGLEEISASSKFTLKSMTYSSGVHLCALTIDAETGVIVFNKYVVAEDCGRIINRAIVDGQLHGGVVDGIGGALLEKMVYDDTGNLLTQSFLDYTIPSSTDSPNIQIFHRSTPSTVSLSLAKGVGESGTIASYAAVMNALNDAISQVHAKTKELNIAPSFPEDVLFAIKK